MRITTNRLSWRIDGHDILQDVDVHFEEGAVTGVVGPNGSGKTTLLHLVAGLRRPSSGSIHYDQVDVRGLTPRQRARRVALCEQHPHTNLDLTVRQVVELGRLPHIGRWPGTKDVGAAMVDEAMSVAEVAGLADRTWSTLSGGEKQRTQLARALAQQPEVLMLDEPTNHLDLRHQISLLHTITHLGLTTVAVLHDLDLAAAFCDQLVVLDAGRLAASGPTREVLRSELVARVFRVDVDIMDTDRPRVLWKGLSQ